MWWRAAATKAAPLFPHSLRWLCLPGCQAPKMSCKGSGLSLWQLEQEQREDVENTGTMEEFHSGLRRLCPEGQGPSLPAQDAGRKNPLSSSHKGIGDPACTQLLANLPRRG